MVIFSFKLTPQIVKSILNPIVCPSWNHFAHLSPVTSTRIVKRKDGGIFHWTPVCHLETGIQVVDIALAALFPTSFWEGHANDTPLHGHFHRLDQLQEQLIFLLGPYLGTSLAFHGCGGVEGGRWWQVDSAFWGRNRVH
jgi:hypothetical protein